MWSECMAELVAAIAPPGCISCGRALGSAAERLCTECTRGLPWLRGGCPRCALPVHRGRRCPASGAAFPRAWAPVAYEGVARNVVRALKFRAALPVADLMAAQIAANLPADLRGAGTGGRRRSPVAAMPRAPPALVPWRRARATGAGFDSARVLALALARRLERPCVDCLVRADRTTRQVGASRRERRAAGRLMVRVRGSPPALALLVDDVHTTGATLDACARALLAEGTTVVAAISYARTL